MNYFSKRYFLIHLIFGLSFCSSGPGKLENKINENFFTKQDSLHYKKLIEKDPDEMYNFPELDSSQIDYNYSDNDSLIYDSIEAGFFQEGISDNFEDDEGW